MTWEEERARELQRIADAVRTRRARRGPADWERDARWEAINDTTAERRGER